MNADPVHAEASTEPETRASLREVCLYFLKLGWLAFGGPVGQIGLMHLECVERRQWISEPEFVEALNFCHVLPGPEALQLAIYIGYRKRGLVGGIIAGALFIAPGYLSLTALGWIYVRYGATSAVTNVLWGFRPVALALILFAIIRIARAALKTRAQVALAVGAFVAFGLLHIGFAYVLIACGLLFIGWTEWRARSAAAAPLVFLALWPRSSEASERTRRLLDISWFFLKTGLLSFGGAYAALPFIREGAVGTYGWITDHQMMDALALGETTPGPLISIGIFVGYLAGHSAGVAFAGSLAATFWLFLPSFVFVLLGAPHFQAITRPRAVKSFLRGVTGGVVGLMLSVALVLGRAAFLHGGRIDWLTVALGIAAFGVLWLWKWRLNVVVVVLGGGAVGLLRALFV